MPPAALARYCTCTTNVTLPLAPGASAPASVHVTAPGLFLAKTVSAGSARPGDALTYTIQYTNLGSQPLSGIVIHDTTPAWTTFSSAGCGALGGGLTGCSVSSQPAAGGTGAVAWSLAGMLAPGASGSVTFVVQVQ